eukprot:2325374-Ditylum_brightwellii.AAC.1
MAPTVKTAEGITQLLNYCATYLNAVVYFHANDMILHVNLDASYLTAPEGCSRAGRHFFLSAASKNLQKPPTVDVPLNNPVHNLCKVMHNVVASAAEAEVGALFSNACMGEQLRTVLCRNGTSTAPCAHLY